MEKTFACNNGETLTSARKHEILDITRNCYQIVELVGAR